MSMSPILFSALIMGLPTIEGNICAGKLLPAYPHFTNCNKIAIIIRNLAENYTSKICDNQKVTWILARENDTQK